MNEGGGNGLFSVKEMKLAKEMGRHYITGTMSGCISSEVTATIVRASRDLVHSLHNTK